MNKISFLFLSTFLVTVSFFANLESVDSSFQLIVAVLFIVLLGIPHGAIDHIIFLEDNATLRPLHFYGFYLGLMSLYLFFWIVFPMFSFILFLTMSAYHFGQSQFSEIPSNQLFGNYILYFIWGTSILSGLSFYNIDEILLTADMSADMSFLSVIFNERLLSILLPLSTIITFFILLIATRKKQISYERFFFEVYILILIHISFYILPLTVGFTLYFVILHSFKVLSEEFSYLKSRRNNFSVSSFIKLLIPFTVVSVVGGSIVMICAQYQLIGISKVLLVFVLISVVTLPHSFVMHDFYKKFTRKTS